MEDEKKFSAIDMMNFEHFSELEKHLATQDESMKNVLSNMYGIKETLDQHIRDGNIADIALVGKFDSFKKECEKRFATKLFEKIVIAMVGMILTAFMLSLFSYIFAPKAFADFVVKILL